MKRGRIKQRISVLEYNRQNIKAEQAQAEQKLREVQTDVVQKEAAEKELNEIISVMNNRRQQSRAAIDAQEKNLTEKKVRLASLVEKRDADLRTITRLQHDLNANDSDVLQKKEEIIACEQQITELSAAIETEQTALQTLYQNLASCETVLSEMKEHRSSEDELLRTKENEIRDIKRKLDDLQRQTSELEMQCREVAPEHG